MSRAQASFEYLAVLALTLVIIVPSIYLFYNYSKQSKEEVTDSQIISIGKQIIGKHTHRECMFLLDKWIDVQRIANPSTP